MRVPARLQLRNAVQLSMLIPDKPGNSIAISVGHVAGSSSVLNCIGKTAVVSLFGNTKNEPHLQFGDLNWHFEGDHEMLA